MNAPDTVSRPTPSVVVINDGLQRGAASTLTAAELGSKAHNLLQMTQAGLPVPPAFVITTQVCRACLEGDIPELVRGEMAVALRQIEAATRRRFGGERRPLLVSVRSGAPVSMPGMLETVLNVGLNDATVRAFIRATGNPRLAWDCYRRLIQCYADVVQGCPAQPFEKVLRRYLAQTSAESERELDAPVLRAIVQEFLDLFHVLAGRRFPQDPRVQLMDAVAAVFRSWQSEKAREYRRLKNIDERMGTAVTVQTMVYGNGGSASGSGVAFTRNPATGERQPYVDFLLNAQGEDVVSGRRTIDTGMDLDVILPAAAAELRQFAQILERQFKDLQDFEFTIEDGRVYLLQTRSGQRTPWAALRVAVDLVREGLIDAHTALRRLDGYDIEAISRSRLVVADGQTLLARATSAGLGAAVGPIALDVEAARRFVAQGQPPVLLREEIATDDIAALALCAGVLSAAGGRTSHAAVVARQIGKVCLVGCEALRIDLTRRCAVFGETSLREGEVISLDGDGGRVFRGAVGYETEMPVDALAEIRRWRSRK